MALELERRCVEQHIVTNMSATLYEHVLLTLLNEAYKNKSEILSHAITKQIINSVKEDMDGINSELSKTYEFTAEWPEGIKRPEHVKEPIINIKFNVKLRSGSTDDVTVGGWWDSGEDGDNILFLEVNVSSKENPPKLTVKHLPKLQAQAYSSVRHEVEHVQQSFDKLAAAAEAGSRIKMMPDDVWDNPEAIKDYFTSPAEVEAFAAGIYNQAKRMHVPFIKNINDTIKRYHDLAVSKGIDKEQAHDIFARIRYVWLKYAKKRFPNAILR